MNLRTTPTRPLEVREHLIDALRADLVGPFAPGEDGEAAEEILPISPSRWYLTGFLAPDTERELPDPTAEEQLAAGDDDDDGELAPADPEPKKKSLLPASLGLSVLLPPGADAVTATVRWADYVLMPEAAGASTPAESVEAAKAGKQRWRRVARASVEVAVPLSPAKLKDGLRILPDDDVVLVGRVAPADGPRLPKGTRALSVFVVNRRTPPEARGRLDEAFLFQAELELASSAGFFPRPDVRGETSADPDDRIADLQYRAVTELAVGHGVSVAQIPDPAGGPARVRTEWLPRAEVRRVTTRAVPAVTTDMEALAELASPNAVRAALGPLVEAYGAWIAEQREIEVGSKPRAELRSALMDDAERAQGRIAQGISRLAEDPECLEAFRVANRAMAIQARRGKPERYPAGAPGPAWRLFQLAFILLDVCSLADENDPDRETVELIYFPTGGGKTEAYLGAIAFTLVLRRLRGKSRLDQGLGVAVILRYTLRLLTLDQLARAATLMCALETLRRDAPETLGAVRFAIGLWVGRSATANSLADVADRIGEYKRSQSKNAASPFPLTECPWCKTELAKDCFDLRPNPKHPTSVHVGCADHRCDFTLRRGGLPVLFVDEQVYAELPAFLVATVDKFALLPWRAEAGRLFGRVHSLDPKGGFGGPPQSGPRPGEVPLPEGLRPPELIVQDELHLISGPLGSMVGLYETAIEALSSREVGGHLVRPKIVASTATVRRAGPQIRALFGRSETAVFPPPGVDPNETFFAQEVKDEPGRVYLGVAATGRSMKALLLRTYVSVLGAAQRHYEPKAGPGQPADPYLTLAGYFNALRELGGMRRLVEDEVRSRLLQIQDRVPEGYAAHPWMARRELREPVELTSRERTSQIAAAKARLAKDFSEKKESVDVLLASNMISVGVDIDRLGLMVVAGQPKTTNEYIQASSRVGRDKDRPGLVVTVLNMNKPRDRSHYERFTSYHDAFYRFVEATSVTPFSGPALDRGLAGLLVALARHLTTQLAAPAAVMKIAEHPALEAQAEGLVALRAALATALDQAASESLQGTVKARGASLLDDWKKIMHQAMSEAAAKRCYSPWDKGAQGKSLLFDALNTDGREDEELRFKAPTSMRDVEASVHLWMQRGRGLDRKGAKHG